MSMFAQMAALMAVALMAAHLIGYFLLLDQRQRLDLVEATGPSVTGFVEVVKQAVDLDQEQRGALLIRSSDFGRRFSQSRSSRLAQRDLSRQRDLEQKLSRALARAEVEVLAVEAGSRRDGFGMGAQRPFLGDMIREPPFRPAEPEPPWPPRLSPGAAPVDPGEARGRPHDAPDMREVVLSVRLADGDWLNVETLSPVPSQGLWWRLISAEALLYVTILAATLFVAGRITRPLGTLSRATAQVGAPGPPPVIAAGGPAEVRMAIKAFNEMSARVAALLLEKDELLGAIGHDLRTPLTSLRIRAEALGEGAERVRMIETLDEMSQLLEDSLDLARLGQSKEEARPVDLSALVDSLVEEYRDKGEDAVFLDSPRAPILCRPMLMRRMARNLIDNALKFGKRAEVSVRFGDDVVEIVVKDDGPGLPEAEFERVLEPFVRLEMSRNRETGGAGLGLAIASRIARAEGARLLLHNAPPGGLVAVVSWRRLRAV